MKNMPWRDLIALVASIGEAWVNNLARPFGDGNTNANGRRECTAGRSVDRRDDLHRQRRTG